MRSLAVVLVLCGVASAAPAKKGPEGLWQGSLDLGAIQLRLAFHIERLSDGTLKSTVDSLDQSANGIPVDQTTFSDSTLRLELPRLKARFEGKLDGDKLVGTWTQASALPLAMKRVDKLEAVKRPQEPRRPFPYKEEEVSVEAKDATQHDERFTLAGTLTLPQGTGPFPAVVLITGSGPQDRDETVFNHKPFLLLADALTRRGIATLRVDDRGAGKSGGSRAKATTHDFVADTRAQLDFLARRPEIDPRAIGLVGHSEGGLIAPMLASQDPRVRFIVMLAGTGMSGEKILYAQSALVERAEGASEQQIERDRADSEKLYQALRKAKTDADVDAAVKTYAGGDPAHKAEREASGPMIRSAWMRTFLFLDPIVYLEKVRVPTLAIAGENDLQVPKENLPLIAAALARAKNADATVKLLPGLNHLFQHTKTGSPMEYAKIEESFAPEASALVSDWVVERTARLRR
jgi:pimeloyl-ACP methyl ester carboxylesterase